MQTALEKFSHYRCIWEKEREEELEEFMRQDPGLSEFEAMLLYYEGLERDIDAECEYYDVGAISLYTEKLKFGLTTETKTWRYQYGKYCNKKYSAEMEEIFAFIEENMKRLSRPIKDLDDIRFVMAALKDIRENEIRIDMAIGPIEVCGIVGEKVSITMFLSNDCTFQ